MNDYGKLAERVERIITAMDELATQHERHLITDDELVRRVLDELIREGDEYKHVAATLGIVLVKGNPAPKDEPVTVCEDTFLITAHTRKYFNEVRPAAADDSRNRDVPGDEQPLMRISSRPPIGTALRYVRHEDVWLFGWTDAILEECSIYIDVSDGTEYAFTWD